MRFLGVGAVAGEIPHARAIPDGAHVITPVNKVQIGIASDSRVGAFHLPAELGLAVVCEDLIAGLPRFLIEAGLDEIQILNGRYAGVCVGVGLGLAEREQKQGRSDGQN
jgi:hypothetical protein